MHCISRLSLPLLVSRPTCCSSSLALRALMPVKVRFLLPWSVCTHLSGAQPQFRKAALLRQQAAVNSFNKAPSSKEGAWLRSCMRQPHLVQPCQHQRRFDLAAARNRRLKSPAGRPPAVGPAAAAYRLAHARPAAGVELRPQLHVKPDVSRLTHHQPDHGKAQCQRLTTLRACYHAQL